MDDYLSVTEPRDDPSTARQARKGSISIVPLLPYYLFSSIFFSLLVCIASARKSLPAFAHSETASRKCTRFNYAYPCHSTAVTSVSETPTNSKADAPKNKNDMKSEVSWWLVIWLQKWIIGNRVALLSCVAVGWPRETQRNTERSELMSWP